MQHGRKQLSKTEFQTVQGRRIAVDLYGGRTRGVPVLLLHGIPGDRTVWSKVGGRLAASRRVIAPDLLGFGDSDAPPSRAFHAAGQAVMLRGLLDALGVEKAHLVGFDFGGPIAVQLYRQEPDRVASLTLAATNLLTDTPIPLPLRLAQVPLAGDLAFRLFFGKLGLSLMWLPAVADRAAFPWAEYRKLLRSRQGIAWTRRIFLASLRDLPGLYGEIERTLSTITIPRRILWGDRDPFFPVEVGRRTAELLGAPLEVLPGCGHFVPEERAQALADRIPT